MRLKKWILNTDEIRHFQPSWPKQLLTVDLTLIQYAKKSFHKGEAGGQTKFLA